MNGLHSIFDAMNRFAGILFLTLVVLFSVSLRAQNSMVVVHGQVFGMNTTTDLLTLFVVSQKNQTGNFGNANGTYQIKVDRSDTILIGSIGYFTEKVCVADSPLVDTLRVDVQLRQLNYYLREVTVLAPRELKRIYEDIEKLGYDPKEDRLSGLADPLSSPITALYEMYSRKAQQERLAKQLGIQKHVIFYNRFVELDELKEFIGAADLYLTPYLNEAQITSGTLAYAFGAGKAVAGLATFWFGIEIFFCQT